MRRSLRRGLLLVVGAAVTWVLYRYLRAFDASVLRRIGAADVLALLAVRAVDVALNLLGSRALLAGLGAAVRPWPLFLVLNASSAGNATTPFKLGLPLRVYLYHRELGVRPREASLAVMVESYASIAVTGVFALYAVSLFFPGRMAQWVAFLVVLALAAAGSVKLWPRLEQLWRGTTPADVEPEASPAPRVSRRRQALALSLFVVLWAADVVVSGALLKVALGALGTEVGLLPLVSFQSLSFVVGVASLLPMGIGAKEASLVFLLGRVGVPVTTAFSAAAIVRLLTTGVSLVAGVLSLNVLGLRRRLP